MRGLVQGVQVELPAKKYRPAELLHEAQPVGPGEVQVRQVGSQAKQNPAEFAVESTNPGLQAVQFVEAKVQLRQAEVSH